MANSLLTLNVITREAVELWKNTNAFINNIDTQYDDSFAVTGAKAGQQIRIRLPNDYVVSNGPALQAQDTSEQSISLVVATQRHVDVSFSTVDRTMSLDDYSERILAPMVNVLAGDVAKTIMAGSEGGVCNLISNVDGTGAIISPVAETFLLANAILDNNSVPDGERKVVNSPFTDAKAVSTLTGLLNPAPEISRQYRRGQMKEGLGYDLWMRDQTVINHTTGTFSAGTVNGAGQTGTTLVVNAITGTLNIGDIITIAGVNAVNRITKADTGELRQFVVTANVINGATSIPIYPAIVPGVGGNTVQYQTVVSSPADAAAISLATPASSVYRKNLAYYPKAITMATVDLELPQRGIVEGARDTYDNISMRMITDYVIGTDQMVTRLDILFGFLYIRPEWAVIICDNT